jgi:hypothetical protein
VFALLAKAIMMSKVGVREENILIFFCKMNAIEHVQQREHYTHKKRRRKRGNIGSLNNIIFRTTSMP